MAPPHPPERVAHRLPPTLRTQARRATPGCVKLHGVFSPCGGMPACAPAPWVHGAPGQDSGDLVDPFMRAGTYPARHLATLRESELLPAFSGASPG